MHDAGLHGLQFVSEAKPSMMSVHDLGERAAAYLDTLGDDIVAREQCIDVLRNRMFRETILCRSSHNLKRDLKASVCTSLYFVSDFRKSGEEGDEVIFVEALTDRVVRTPKDEHSELLRMVGEGGYAGVSFRQLVDGTSAAFGRRFDERAVMHGLIRLWNWGFLDVTLERAPIQSQPRGVARASRLARYQAAAGDRFVTALQHRSCELSPAERAIILASDGARQFKDIVGSSPESEEALRRLLSLGFFYE
jgi:methyltransferase-like protein